MPSAAAVARALARAVARSRRVTSPSVSAARPERLNSAGGVQTRSSMYNPRLKAELTTDVDASALDIRTAVPDDARALAATTRLGFDSYRSWAPAGWEPPPHALELRSIRERLRQPTTW